MTDSTIIIIQQEEIAPLEIVEREILLAEQVTPIAIESSAVEVVTLESETYIVDEVPQISILTVGEPGPKGDIGEPGPSGEGTLTKIAGMILGGHRVIVLDAVGQAIYADHTDITHRDKVLGLTLGAALEDAEVSIKTYGEITEPSWTWTLNEPVYLGTLGQLTQVLPITGFLMRIGFPIASDKLFVDIDVAFTL